MFKHIDFPTSDWQIRQSWNRLIRIIQEDVEHKRVTNTSGGAMVKGDIVYVEDSDRNVDLAVNDTEVHADWVAVMAEPAADGETGIARTEGYALVHFTAASVLANQEGLPVYVSATAGQATIVAPDDPDFTSHVGILGDATEFDGATNPFAWVFLRNSCGIGDPVPQ